MEVSFIYEDWLHEVIYVQKQFIVSSMLANEGFLFAWFSYRDHIPIKIYVKRVFDGG